MIEREINASKRFRINEDSYIIKPECIFRKNIDGQLRSVSYYREGNPNPYDFEEENTGIKNKELDRFYAEDFYNIIVDLEIDRKTIYILLVVIINFALSLTFDISVLFNEYLLGG